MRLATIFLCTFAGIFLGGAYWVYADGCIAYSLAHTEPYRFKWVVPGLLTTLAVVALNVGVTPSTVVAQWEARLWAFCWVTTAFVGIGLSIWILVADGVIGGGQQWASISILLQTMLIMLAGLLFFVRQGACGNRGSDSYAL